MDNVPTFTTTLSNRAVEPTTLLDTVLQFPVFWNDLDMTWDEIGITWNQGTDSTALTNVTI